MRNGKAFPQLPRQDGVALVISLVMLVAMTILGVSTLTGTRLNEKITHNAQQKTITFEAAESALNSGFDADLMMLSAQQIPAGVLHNPAPTEPAGLAAVLSANFDQANALGTSVDITAKVSIQFCGETALPKGASLSADEGKAQMAGLLFDVNGLASILNSNAKSDHVQRGSLTRIKTGRTGNCIVPGV